MISFDHVSKHLDGLPVVSGIDLTVPDGSIVVLIGPSGCGKSTLLNMAAGLIEADGGSIRSDGGSVSYMFQENRLLPWRTVRENIRLACPKAADDDVTRIIDAVGLKGFEDYPPARLSGGMAKRCALARAFSHDGTTLLMDEPFSGLDYCLRMEMADLLLGLWRERRQAVLFVTHEIDEALMLGTRLAVLSKRPARIARTFELPGAEGRDPSDPALAEIRREVIALISGRTPAANTIAWKAGGEGDGRIVATAQAPSAAEARTVAKAGCETNADGERADGKRAGASEDRSEREGAPAAVGLDCGSSTAKAVAVDGRGRVVFARERANEGSPRACADALLRELANAVPDAAALPCRCTGVHSAALFSTARPDALVGDVPALVAGAKALCPDARSVFEIGAQSARFATSLSGERPPQFARNQHCAGGTGSFFEDQMERLGLDIQDFSPLVETAGACPQISGRCSVFAKSDIIHRQQEGASTPDILAGLCRATARNFKATVVRNLAVDTPVVLAGGTARNSGLAKALRDVFELGREDLVVPADAPFASAIGAALHALESRDGARLQDLSRALADAEAEKLPRLDSLAPWALPAQEDPPRTPIPADVPCCIGVDVGSTSTNLAVCGEDGELLDFWYLRTGGDSAEAVRRAFDRLRQACPAVRVKAVGVTGSGRVRAGRTLRADVVENEITAQAAATVRLVPDATSVLEIGGQDSKFIRLENGVPTDFRMNKICAAGTGSFMEEQTARLGIALDRAGDLAVAAPSPAYVGERCTVFMESAVNDVLSAGADVADVVAGLCHAIVANYRAKVVGSLPAGDRPVLQGGVAYNRGIVAAFRAAFGEGLRVLPCFSVSGAYGAALLARDKAAEPGFESSFVGVEAAADGRTGEETAGEAGDGASAGRPAKTACGLDGARRPLREGGEDESLRPPAAPQIARSGRDGGGRSPLLADYDGAVDPGKRTVGIPFVLMIHKFFPMANAFFTSLGYNVLLSEPTDEETVRLSQNLAQTEACYPVKLVYGHMEKLAQRKVDFVFLPSVYSMRNEHSAAAHCYGCVHLQTAARAVFGALGLEERGIGLLNPVFALEDGKKGMAGAMVRMAMQLGHPRPRIMRALAQGMAAMKRFQARQRQRGDDVVKGLRPGEKAFVLITRPYGTNDPVLNMGIPRLLEERGCRVLTQAALPIEDVDLSEDYPDMCWPFGEHILAAAKIVAAHPRLFAVYLTNHGCGPDSMLSHLVRAELEGKPALCIETDEHFSPVGLITRVEAFLRCVEAWEAAQTGNAPATEAGVAPPPSLRDLQLAHRPSPVLTAPDPACPVLVPGGPAAPFLTACLEKAGLRALPTDAVDESVLKAGSDHADTKEYVEFVAYAGLLHRALEERGTRRKDAGDGSPAQLLVPSTEGAEADGLYAQVLARMLPEGSPVRVWSPKLETLFATARDPRALFCALSAYDLAQTARPEARRNLLERLSGDGIPSLDALPEWARFAAGSWAGGTSRLGVVGSLPCVHLFDGGVTEELERRGYRIVRAPLSESLWFLAGDADAEWKESPLARELKEALEEIARACGPSGSFAAGPDGLFDEADALYPRLAGGLGRYRAAKAVRLSRTCDAVLSIAPEYENTESVLALSGLPLSGPLFRCAVGGVWEADSWSALDSFLHYVKRPAR